MAKGTLLRILTLIMICFFPDAHCQDLLVFPKRVVFEGTKKKSETVTLSNPGNDTARYDISFVQIRMTEEGGFEFITEPDPGQLFAEPYLRIFPRRVVLGPNESQVVKIQLNRTEGMQAGEYRSHIYFRSVPNAPPLGEEEVRRKDDTSISIQLTPVYGITIPVIIRHGESTTQVRLSDLAFEMFEGTQPVLAMQFNRVGNMSSYGDIEITHVSNDGKKTLAGKITGFAVYAPGNLRRTRIALKPAEGVNIRSGKLVVAYYSTGKNGRKTVLAEAELAMP